MPPTANERLRDLLLRHSLGLDRLTATQVRQIEAIYREVERELLRRLKQRVARALTVGEEAGPETTRILFRAVAEIRSILNGRMPAIGEQLAGELQGLAEYEAQFMAGRLQEVVPARIQAFRGIHVPRPDVVAGLVASTPFQGRLLGTYFGNGPRSFSAFVQRELTKQIRRSIAAGLGIEDTARRLNRRLVTMRRHNLRALVRTASQHATRVARDRVVQANTGAQGVVKGYQWLSTLDLRTTLEYCIPRDGKAYDLEFNPIDHALEWGAGPGMIHWQCRSTYTVALKSWRELGIKAREIQRRDRASMSGPVPAKTTAEAFFMRQVRSKRGRAFLESIHGKRRIEALAQGEVTIAEMLDPAVPGRLLSLDELGLLEG